MTFKMFCKTYHIPGLNPQQERAVKKIDGATLLLAVPGSGKTTVIVTRIGYMMKVRGIPAENILTLTYTKAAATEMKERFAKKFNTSPEETPQFSTINSFCLSVIWICAKEKGIFIPTLIPNNELLVRDLARTLMKEYPSDASVKMLCQQIGQVKNTMLSEEEIGAISNPDLEFAEFFDLYQEYLRKERLMDFDDQLIMAYHLLKTYPDILHRAQEKYRYISLDEAQDTSLIQHKIIELLVGKTGNIFMVGDEDQSIYGFRGAYPKALLDFEQTYANAEILYMETNYRSDLAIVNTANTFIKRNKSRHDKNMRTPSKPNGSIVITELNDMRQEPQYLLELITDHLASSGNSTLAILYRNNDSAVPLTKYLQENGIVVREREETSSMFFSHFIVKDILSFFSFIQNPYDFEIFGQLYYKMGLYLKKADLKEIRKISEMQRVPVLSAIQSIPSLRKQGNIAGKIQAAFSSVQSAPPEQVLTTIVKGDCGWKGYWRIWIKRYIDQNKISSTTAGIKVNILRLMSGWYSTIENFLHAMEALKEINSDPSSRVTLSTIHSSKGLEFDKVIMIDVVESILPQTRVDMTADEKEEEARLFYVGATRAKHELEFVISRKFYNLDLKKSEFLDPYENSGGIIFDSRYAISSQKGKTEKTPRKLQLPKSSSIIL